MADSSPALLAEIEKLEHKHAEFPEGRYFVPLANAYRRQGEIGRAEALLHQGLRRHPDYLSAHIVLGRCLADRGALEEAEAEFRFVLSQDPQNLIALRTLGELAASSGRPDEGRAWFEQLLAVDPMNDEARRSLETLGGDARERAEAEFREGPGWWERPGDDADAPGEPVAEDASPPEPASVPEEPAAATAAADADEEPAADAGSPELEGELPELRPAAVGGADALGDVLVHDREEGEHAPVEEPEEVVTETIAELYARQGFPDRAAGVYRELIRRRGADAALELRLAELEAEAAGVVDAGSLGLAPAVEAPLDAELAALVVPAGEEGLAPLAPAEVAPDAFADSFAEGFAGAAVAPRPEREPETGAGPEPGAAPERLTISGYLRELIAGRAAGAEPGPAATAGPAGAAAAVEEPPAPVAEAPDAGGATSGTGPAEDEPFPWEVPLGQDAGEAEELASFETFIEGEAGGAPGGAEPEPAPAPEPRPAVEPAPRPGDAEDDDLESFQAWLRSLKR